MAGEVSPDPQGIEAPSARLVGVDDHRVPGAGYEELGPLGDDPIPLKSGDRIVTAVTKDWTPPTPSTTPAIVVNGKTLADVANELNKLSEWGRGGGMLRTDPVPVGTSPTVTVNVRGGLIRVLPTWSKYSQASPAARAEWDRMVAKLAIHEDRHMAIAIEEAENLAKALIGVEILEIPRLVTEANKTLHDRQVDFDDGNDHGAKEGVPYGDVYLDTTIT